MRAFIFICFCSLLSGNLVAQTPAFLGAGNDQNITVTSSSTFQNPIWNAPSNPENTVNGKGMLADYFDACRFLNQASLGFDSSHVAEALSRGYEGWIDDQFTKPVEDVLSRTGSIFDYLNNLSPEDDRRPDWRHFSYAWWDVNTTNEDLLRHKVACALSEILVISRNSELAGYGDGLAHYYDILLKNAFGNYRDLLLDVALHPCMGYYLSHLNNPKSHGDVHPDENFAREIMQLMSIGLYLLDNDGSHTLINGQEVATYDNDDINEFAKVFTGLGVGAIEPELDDPDVTWDDEPYFGMGLWVADLTVPMQMYDTDDPGTSWKDENQHEPGPKYLLNGFVVPDGQSGMQDINDAIDNLFNHPNVGPFIGYRLIQRLVKSNPSPAYISRVTDAFNGSGPYGTVRGDMKSVIKAILLDEEARDVNYQMSDVHSRLKEPLFRYTHFTRSIEKLNLHGFFWNIAYYFYEETKQAILASPSVFNFFLPDDSPNGEINDQGLVAPEFKLHDSRTSVGFLNNVYGWTQSWGDVMNTWEGELMNGTDVEWVIDDLLAMADDSETYINWLDKHILNGTMSDFTRNVIRTALNGFDPNTEWHDHRENRVRMGMYLALISPDYNIMR